MLSNFRWLSPSEPHPSVLCKSGFIDLLNLSFDLFEVLCHTTMVAASRRGATGISQRFPTVILKELQRLWMLILWDCRGNYVESKRFQRITVLLRWWVCNPTASSTVEWMETVQNQRVLSPLSGGRENRCHNESSKQRNRNPSIDTLWGFGGLPMESTENQWRRIEMNVKAFENPTARDGL